MFFKSCSIAFFTLVTHRINAETDLDEFDYLNALDQLPDSINSCHDWNTDPLGLNYEGFISTALVIDDSKEQKHQKNKIEGTCQHWDSDSPNENEYKDFKPNHNFCRNPNQDKNGPWCYLQEYSKTFYMNLKGKRRYYDKKQWLKNFGYCKTFIPQCGEIASPTAKPLIKPGKPPMKPGNPIKSVSPNENDSSENSSIDFDTANQIPLFSIEFKGKTKQFYPFQNLTRSDPNCAKLTKPESDCRAALSIYYYDPVTNQCRYTTYGGCGENDNIYAEPDECLYRCGDANTGLDFEELGYQQGGIEWESDEFVIKRLKDMTDYYTLYRDKLNE